MQVSSGTNYDKENLERVLKLQKRAARVILFNAPSSPPPPSWIEPPVPLFNRLKCLSFYKDALISKCIMAYKRLQGDIPVYLNNLLKVNSNIRSRQTRYCNLFPNLSEVYSRNRRWQNFYRHNLQSMERWHGTLPVRKRDSVDSLKKHRGMNFLNNSRILIIFLFKLLDELWHDCNAIFHLLNSLVDTIVSVFFGFYFVFFIA